MKKVRILTGQVGLVIKKGNYNRVLTEGVYWIRFSEEVIEYDLTKPFNPSVDLNILMKDKTLADMLIVVEVKDNEIAIQFQNGNYKNVLMPGRYAFWKGVTEYTFTKVDLSKYEITEEIPESVLMKPEVLQFMRIYTVEAFEKGMLIVNGKMMKVLEAGVYLYWKNSAILNVIKSDLRQQQVEISGQEMLTRDKAALRVNFYAKYQTVDIQKALAGNKDFEKQLYILMQLSLREYVGMYTLDELLENKVSVSEKILAAVKDKAAALGVTVLDCGIRDVILPGEVKDIMNQVLIAEKKAQSNTITRREETASVRSMLNTAKLMEDNTMLYRLKEMEYMEKIADKINTISISGGNQILDQMKALFSPVK